MNFEEAEIDNSNTPNNKSKVLGVIVLTDNRRTPEHSKDFSQTKKSSAFRCIDLSNKKLNSIP